MPRTDAILDTDVLVDVLRARPEALAWLESQPAAALGIPVITWMELIQGARDRGEQERIVSRLSAHSIVHIESGDPQLASAWFATYWLSHKVGILDCLIAAIAVRVGAPLYTFNTAHFRVIPGLDVRSPYQRAENSGTEE